MIARRIKQSKTTLRRVMGDRSGATAVIAGVSLTLLVGSLGLAIDVADWLNAVGSMQAAADQGAYSAASAAGTGACPNDAATTQAKAIVGARGYVDGQNNTTVSVSCANSTSFKVSVSQDQPMWFTKLFLSSAPKATRSAVARVAGKQTDLCILALDGTNPSSGYTGSDDDSMYVTGSTNVNVGCGIAVDSSSASSLGAGSNAASLTATDIYLVGSDQASSNGYTPSITATGCSNCNPVIPPGQILTYQRTVIDPYADRVVPDHNCASTQAQSFKNTSISPGTFCGGLSLDGNISVNCGTYVIAGGSLSMTSTANVVQTSCNSGVTFILTNSKPGANDYASMQYSGNPSSSLILTAPTSGAYGGLVFFQDRNAPNPNSGTNNNNTCGSGAAQNKIAGSANQVITGAIYFPAQVLCFGGGSSSNSANKCTQLIAYNLNFTGNSALQSKCDGVGIASMSVTTPQLIQ